MKLLSLIFLVGLILPIAAKEDGRTIKVRVLCFEILPGERELTASGDPDLASAETIELSRRLNSQQARLMIFGNQVQIGNLGTDEAQKKVIDPVAVATIPPTGNQFLILMVPSGKKEGEIYKCMVLSDDAKDFPDGAFRLINLSHSPMRFAMGDQRVDLPPGKIEIVKKITGVREDGRFGYVAQYQDGEIWNRLSTGYWNWREHVRSLQIAYLDPRTKRLTMRGYDDTLNRNATKEPR